MKFESKAHMAQELMSGKQFTSHLGGVIHYDPDPELTCPFRYGDTSIGGVWELYCKDIWTEVTPVHTHQALIDAYHEGQAWQFTNPYMNGVYADCTGCGVWIEPAWDERVAYRLHPHNTLIQEHSAGAKIQAYVETFGAWIEQANPDWDTDVQYRVKPAVKVVYEWVFKAKHRNSWKVEGFLLSEEEAEDFFDNHEYRKTGRSWEVEA
jgi:hypothetical protein